MTNNKNILNSYPSFPSTRMRRNRQFDWSRRLVRENHLSVDDLIWPIFVTENKKTEIKTMPGIYRIPLTEIADIVDEAQSYGIPAIALFPETNPNIKDDKGSEALNSNNIICEATRIIKKTMRI